MLTCWIRTKDKKDIIKPFPDYAAIKAYSRNKSNNVHTMTDRTILFNNGPVTFTSDYNNEFNYSYYNSLINLLEANIKDKTFKDSIYYIDKIKKDCINLKHKGFMLFKSDL